MCDNAECAQLFSVNERGWKEFTERIDAKDGNTFNHGMRIMHMCPDCAPQGSPANRLRPRVAMRELESPKDGN